MRKEQVQKTFDENFTIKNIIADSILEVPKELRFDKTGEKWKAAGRPHLWVKNEKETLCEGDTIVIYKDWVYGYMAAMIKDDTIAFGSKDITLKSKKTGNEYLIQSEFYGHKEFKIFKAIIE